MERRRGGGRGGGGGRRRDGKIEGEREAKMEEEVEMEV